MFLWRDDDVPPGRKSLPAALHPDEVRWVAVFLSVVLALGVVPVLAAVFGDGGTYCSECGGAKGMTAIPVSGSMATDEEMK
jgi:hypothetical protein